LHFSTLIIYHLSQGFKTFFNAKFFLPSNIVSKNERLISRRYFQKSSITMLAKFVALCGVPHKFKGPVQRF